MSDFDKFADKSNALTTGFDKLPISDSGRKTDHEGIPSSEFVTTQASPANAVKPNVDDNGVNTQESSFEGVEFDDDPSRNSMATELSGETKRTRLVGAVDVELIDRLDDEDDPNTRDKEDKKTRGVSANLRCAACGHEGCGGHEEDSVDYLIMVAHASNDHGNCHPDGCSLIGRSIHSHTCTNCGGNTPCGGTKTSSVCDTFDGFCKTCFISLARMDKVLGAPKVDKKKLNEHLRKRNVNAPAVTEAEAELAMGAGHSLEQARKKVGPHRPKKAAETAELYDHKYRFTLPKPKPQFYDQEDELIFHEGDRPQVQVDLQTGEEQMWHPGLQTRRGPVKSSVEENLPAWLKEAKEIIEADKTGDSEDSFVPPSSVASAAKRGLELRRKHNRGGTEVGVARARDLSNRKGLSYKTVKRMKAYFDRHEVDKKGEGWGKDSAGYIAWLLWGGDAGRSWANKIIKQKEKKSSVEYDVHASDLADARMDEEMEAALLEKAGISREMTRSLSPEEIQAIRKRITEGDTVSPEESV